MERCILVRPFEQEALYDVLMRLMNCGIEGICANMR